MADSAEKIGSQRVADMTVAELHIQLIRYRQAWERQETNWCPPPEHIPGPHVADSEVQP